MSDPRLSPLRAPLAFRVSVVGHRPNRLPKGPAELALLRSRVAAALAAAKEAVLAFAADDSHAKLYADAPPILRAISPLAEGSDRMFAEEALKLGYSLCCPMPFAQADFEQDFAPGTALEPHSVDRFRGLLDQARSSAGLTAFELDGERTNADTKAAAYGAAARVVMNQSDLMIVVWDGGESAGPGGTVDTLYEAVRFRVPILWIDAVAPFAWTLVRSEADLAFLDSVGRCTPPRKPSEDAEAEHRMMAAAVAKIVHREIALPGADAADSRTEEELKAQLAVLAEAKAHGTDYFRERRPLLNLFFVWKLFRNLIGDTKFVFPAIRTTDFVQAIRSRWPTSEDEAPAGRHRGPTAFWVNAAVRGHFAWSDQLADDYADAYRTAFILSYLLAALAVAIALLPRAIGWTAQAQMGLDGASIKAISAVFSVGEFAVLSAILALVIWGRYRRWHERWMEYRVLAELIRELKFLIPLGGGRPLPRTPTHLGVYGDPVQTWMYWQLRAIARATGIPNVKTSKEHLAESISSLIEVTADQREFHDINYRRYEHLHNRLHHATLFIFGLTMVTIAVQLAAEFLWKGPPVGHLHAGASSDWLILASGFLPALAAALAGIDNHGEFLRIAKRSRGLESGFVRFGKVAEGMRDRLHAGERVPLAEVTPLASKIAETMVDEVMDWRIVVLDRPQTAG